MALTFAGTADIAAFEAARERLDDRRRDHDGPAERVGADVASLRAEAARDAEAGRYEDAADVFRSLLRTADRRGHADADLVGLWTVERAELVARFGASLTEVPADAAVEEVLRVDGADVAVYAVEPEVRAYIGVCDRMATHLFTEVDASWADGWRPSWLYEPAAILMARHRYGEARPWLARVVNEVPQSTEGTAAAREWIDASRRYGSDVIAPRRFVEPPWDDGGPPTPKPPLHDDPGCVRWAEGRVARGHSDLQTAYVEFVDAVARGAASPCLPRATFDAGLVAELLSDDVAADRYYSEVERGWPDLSTPSLHFRIASLREARMDLDGAVRAYEGLMQAPARDVDVAAASYDAAVLESLLGRHTEAADGYERYGREFPGEADAEEVRLLAGAELEKVDRQDAIAFYRAVPTWASDPLTVLRADARLAELSPSADRDAVVLRDAAALPVVQRDEIVRAIVGRSAVRVVERRADGLSKPTRAEAAAFADWATRTVEPWDDFDATTGALWFVAEVDAKASDEAGRRSALTAILSLADREERWGRWAGKAAAALHEVDGGRWPVPMDEVREGPASEGRRPMPVTADQAAER